MGTGAKSGRSAGFCAGFGTPGFANPQMTGNPGALMRRNRRRWCATQPVFRGRRRQWGLAADRPGREYFNDYPLTPQPIDSESEKEALKSRSQALRAELTATNKRLEEIIDKEKTS
jgi:hypothetical protein